MKQYILNETCRNIVRSIIPSEKYAIEEIEAIQKFATEYFKVHDSDTYFEWSFTFWRSNRHVLIVFYRKEFEVEDVPEYNPKRWNKYPDVTPPYGVMMRLKMKSGVLRAGYLKKFSEGDFWCNSNHIIMSRAENLDVDMFKPWDD